MMLNLCAASVVLLLGLLGHWKAVWGVSLPVMLFNAAALLMYQRKVDLIAEAIIARTKDLEYPLPNVSFELAKITNSVETLCFRLEEYEATVSERSKKLAETNVKLAVKTIKDQLTGAFNRRFFDDQINVMATKGQEFSLIFFDIDHFKKVNDTYGHQAGDDVLKMFASIVRDCIRPGDIFARYGGEEFVIVAKSGPDGARALAERLRQSVEATVFQTFSGDLRITASFGIARFQQGEPVEAFIARADEAVYKAKINGRNRVEISY
jgi:diguanylate cyclase (GGDEF)-like protein